MSGTRSPRFRPCNGHIVCVGADPKRGRKAYLDTLLTAEGIVGYRERAEYLNASVGAVHRAINGGRVSSQIIFAVRVRFPDVPYEDVFKEQISKPERGARDDSTANRAA